MSRPHPATSTTPTPTDPRAHLTNAPAPAPVPAVTRSASQRTTNGPPPVPPPDVVSYFDPASAGGGGPLRRISTQQKERAEAYEREKATREAAGLPVDEGFLSRFRSASFGNRTRPIGSLAPLAPITTVPLIDERAERERGERGESATRAGRSLSYTRRQSDGRERGQIDVDPLTPALSSAWSSKTLAALGDEHEKHQEKDIESRRPSVAVDDHEIEATYPDGGYGWVVLCACISLAGLTMGWGMTIGVLLAYVGENMFPDTSSIYLSTAFTTSTLFMCISSFFAGRLGDRFGFKRILYLSAAIAWVGLFSAAFASEVWHILLTIGIVQGTGIGLAVPLFMSLPSQWFFKRRGFASGAAIGGAGLGGGFAAIIMRQMLVDLGYKKTLIILSFINLALSLIATCLIRTRACPESERPKGGAPWFDPDVCSTFRFWAIFISLVVACFGYSTPFAYLPKYVLSTFPDINPTLQGLPSTLMGFSICFGRALAGAAADRIGPLNTYLIVFLLTAVVNLALWLTATTFAHTCAFAVLFGICGPGFLSMVPQIVVALFGAHNLATNVGLLLLAMAPANFAVGPVGGVLYDMTGRTTYKWLIVMGGIASFVGFCLASMARLGTERKIWAKV